MSPMALSWTELARWGAGAAALVSLLYLLRTRRRRVRVPSNALWAALLAERPASSLWRRLRRPLSWALALLLGALILGAAADFRPPKQALAGRSYVVLLDHSASMAASDVPGGRWAASVAQAQALLAGLGEDDRALLLAVDDQVVPLGPFTRDPEVFERAFASVGPPVASRAKWGRALRFAASALRGRPLGRAIVFTDGAFHGDELRAPPGLTLELREIGAPASGNLAILAFNVRRYPAHRLSYEVFVRVKSYDERPRTCTLQIWADGRLAESLPLALGPGEDLQRIFPDLSALGRRLEARLVAAEGEVDPLPLDDRAFALLPEMPRRRVVLVSRGNLFLEAALLLDEQLELRRVSPAEFADLGPADFDLLVLDRVADRPELPGPRVLVAPPAGGSAWEPKGEIAEPQPGNPKRHALLRWVTFTDLNIAKAQRIKARPGDEVLLACPQGPLLLARRDAQRPTLYLAFDPLDSDLPLRMAFPLLWLNAVEWFFDQDGALLATYRTGENWRVRIPGATGAAGATEEVIWLRPDGSRQPLPLHEGQVTLRGRQPGFHRLLLAGAAEDEAVWLAANMADAAESDLRPRGEGAPAPAAPGAAPADADAGPAVAAADAGSPKPDGGLAAGGGDAGRPAAPAGGSPTTAAAGQAEASPTPAAPRQAPRYELWELLLFYALALQLLEWLLYHRRVTV